MIRHIQKFKLLTKRLLTDAHRLPKSNVDLVSDSLKDAGEQQIIIVVLALPPNDSCNIRVNLESR